jgi:hypothetical protein
VLGDGKSTVYPALRTELRSRSPRSRVNTAKNLLTLVVNVVCGGWLYVGGLPSDQPPADGIIAVG